MRLSLSSIAGSIGILLVAIVLSVSCRPDAPDVGPDVEPDVEPDVDTRLMHGICSLKKDAMWENIAVPGTTGTPCVLSPKSSFD